MVGVLHISEPNGDCYTRKRLLSPRLTVSETALLLLVILIRGYKKHRRAKKVLTPIPHCGRYIARLEGTNTTRLFLSIELTNRPNLLGVGVGREFTKV